MPRLMIPIDSLEETVGRPVALDISRQLVEATRLPSTVQFIYPGDEERVAITGSTIDNKHSEKTVFPHEAQISLDVTEEVEEDNVLTRAVLYDENKPFFVDQLLGIVIKPVYVHTNVELAFSARFVDKNAAIKWRSEMQNKIAMMRDTLLHKVHYSYIIPVPAIMLLQEIHRLRENQAGYGDTWEEYFKMAKAPNVTALTNVGGLVERLGVRETQQRIIGQFDFKTEPEKGSKESDSDTWTITFTYKFAYDKPNAIVMEYPLVIHNQMLDQEYRPNRKDAPAPQLIDYKRQFTNSFDYIHQLESDRDAERWKAQQKGISIPDFDEFIPLSVPEGTYRIITWLIGLTVQDRRDLINVKDLPGAGGMDTKVYQFLIEELPFIGKETKSVFNVSVYENEIRLEERLFKVNPDGNVTGLDNYNLRKTYHVRLGIYYDLSLLDEAALDRLRKHPDVLKTIINELFPNYKNLYGFDWWDKFLVGPGYLSKDFMNRLINQINYGSEWGPPGHPDYGRTGRDGDYNGRHNHPDQKDHLRKKGRGNTVQTLFVHSIRNNDTHPDREDLYYFNN